MSELELWWSQAFELDIVWNSYILPHHTRKVCFADLG